MPPQNRNQAELIAELEALRERVAALEAAEARYQRLSEAWRELSAQYEATIEAFDGFIYICSQNYEIEFMNQRFIERQGDYPLGRKCYQALHGRDAVCPWCVNDRVFAGETVRWEVQSPKDQRWYSVINTLIRHPDGSLSKMAMIQDITIQKRMEKAIQESEACYRSIFENAVVGIFQTSPAGRLITVNLALARLHGYDSPEEMVAAATDPDRQLFVDPTIWAQMKREMDATGILRARELRVRRKDGSIFQVLVDARAVRDDRGVISYYEGFVQDITARPRAEIAETGS